MSFAPVFAAPVHAPALQSVPHPLQVSDSAAPTFSVYNGQDGVGDDIWSAIGFDKRGFVWAGSASSLAWFDGYRWHMWPLPGAPSLVRAMASAPDGTLWGIFEHGGLAHYDGHKWVLAGTSQFFQRFSLITTQQGPQLWAVGKKALLYLQGGVWHDDPDNTTRGLPRSRAFEQTLKLFGGPRQWYGSDQGLWYRVLKPNAKPGPWRRFDRPEINRMPITDLLTSVNDAGQEELWVLSYGGGLARIRADGIRLWSADAGQLPSGALYSMVETHNVSGKRRLWVASRGGLLRIRDDGKHIDVFDRHNGLPSNAVRGLKVQHLDDGANALWVATEGGIARAVLNASPWRTVSLLGSKYKGIFALMIEPDGRGGKRLWVGASKDGLAMLDQGKWRRFNKANGALPSNVVRGIWRLPGENGQAEDVLSLVGHGLLRLNGKLHFVPMHTPWPIGPDEAATDALARLHNGALEWWLSTRFNGIYRRRGGKWTHFTVQRAPRKVRVLDLAEQMDSQGKSWLWAATSQGLALFDGKSWSLLQNIPGLQRYGYSSVTLLGKGQTRQLWAGTFRNGIVRLDVSHPRRPYLLDNKGLPPLPDQTVYSILPDSQGRLYICTNNGVQQLTPKVAGGYSSRVFDRGDGMVSDECNASVQLIDDHNRYWVGTLGGLSMYDPRVETPETDQPHEPLYLTSLRINGKASVFPDSASLDLPPGDNRLQIHYTLLSGQRENETKYQSQLLGYELQPTAWTDSHQRNFTSLPPGDYELRIEARDFNGAQSAPLSLKFTIEPHWWQRRVWQVVIGVLALLVIFSVAMAYNRGLRIRQRLLRTVVAERTQELSVANERLTQLSYLDPLTGAANRRRLMEAMNAVIDHARKKHLPIGLIVADIDRFKDYNDRHGHLAGDTALQAVAEVMKKATRKQDLVARFGGEEFVCLMADAHLQEVADVAERIRSRAADLPARALGNKTQKITLSAGMLSLVPRAQDSPESLLKAADEALYKAKGGGRNQVVQKTPYGFAPCEAAPNPNL